MSGHRIWYWKYSLKSRAALNAVTDSLEHEGALIRDYGGGVGCIHPWPELGDSPLEGQLASLLSGWPLPLAEQALNCAEIDGLSRREGVNLFDRLRDPIPPSHWTASPDDDPARVASEGFRAVKLKAGADPEKTRREIVRWRSGAPELRLRIDFNESCSREAVTTLWNSLSDDERSAIEFLEDPLPWNPEEWRALRELGIPLAADRDVLERAGEADWLVVKPACVHPVRVGEIAMGTNQPLVFTSAMDHAIGQLYAAWRAGEAASVFPDQVSDGGLLTHELFEPDPFFEQLGREGSRLIPPGGTGLGFDEILESLPWKVIG